MSKKVYFIKVLSYFKLMEKIKNKNNKKKKIWLPLFVFILFFGSSLAYFSIFKAPSYEDENSKLVIEYLKRKYNIKALYAATSSENDICYIVSVYVSQDKGLNVCLTKDESYISPFFYTRNSKDLLEDLEIINFNFNLPVNFQRDLKLIENKGAYKVYKISKQLAEVELGKFILVSNNTIVMFAEKIENN